jgi:hypothetical protein
MKVETVGLIGIVVVGKGDHERLPIEHEADVRDQTARKNIGGFFGDAPFGVLRDLGRFGSLG